MDVKITDNSDKTLAEFEKAVERGLEACGMVAEGYAKEDTPVDTGRLRNYITYSVQSDGVYIGTNVEYAPVIELGNASRKAHHMLKNAVNNHADEYRKLILDSLDNS